MSWLIWARHSCAVAACAGSRGEHALETGGIEGLVACVTRMSCGSDVLCFKNAEVGMEVVESGTPYTNKALLNSKHESMELRSVLH